jgi:hypothetical protein
MLSPPAATPPPEGSSRVTGGFSRGRAIGNVYNLSDAADLLPDHIVPATGKVRLYSDLTHQPGVDKPKFTLKAEATPRLGPVLAKLGRLNSPVRKADPHMYVHEDGEWSLKGRLRYAIEDNAEVTWETENGQLCISLCADGRNILAAPSASHAPVVSMGTWWWWWCPSQHGR